jgi:hypothetical protein
MYPAATMGFSAAIWVALVFSGITILTMTALVTASVYGINFVSLKFMERYTHALAGFTVLMCGIAIKFLGL